MANNKETLVQLTIEGENKLAKPTEEATKHLEELQDGARLTRNELKRLEEQKGLIEAVRSTGAELDRAKEKFENATAEVERLKKSHKGAEKQTEEYAKAIALAKSNQQAANSEYKRYAKSLERTEAQLRKAGISSRDYGAALERVNKKIEQTTIEVKKSDKAYREYGQKIAEAKKQMERAAATTDRMSKRAMENAQANEKLKARLDSARKSIKRTSEETEKHSKATLSSSLHLKEFVSAYTAYMAAMKGGEIVKDTVNQFGDFEEALIGVSKTTTLSQDELNQLGAEMQRLSQEVTPTTANELLNIAEAAGRMGIQGADNLQKFVETLDRLGVSSDLVGEEAATQLARLLTVTGESQGNIDRLASSIVELGNNFAATESEIAFFSQRLASSVAEFDLSSAEITGIATAMKQVGIQAEAGSTVVGRVFRKMSEAIEQGGVKMQAFEEITGKSSDALKLAFSEDKAGLLIDFAQGLERMKNSGQGLTGVLAEMELKNDENLRIIPTLAKSHEELARAVQLSTDEFKRNQALLIESNKFYDSQNSAVNRVQNAFTNLKSAIGDALSDETQELMEKFAAYIDTNKESLIGMGEALGQVVFNVAEAGLAIVDFIKENQELGKVLGTLAGAYGISKVIKLLVSLGNTFIGTGKNLGGLITKFAAFAPILAAMEVALFSLQGTMEDYNKALKKAAESQQLLSETIKQGDIKAKELGESLGITVENLDEMVELQDKGVVVMDEHTGKISILIDKYEELTGKIVKQTEANKEAFDKKRKEEMIQSEKDMQAVLEGRVSLYSSLIDSHKKIVQAEIEQRISTGELVEQNGIYYQSVIDAETGQQKLIKTNYDWIYVQRKVVEEGVEYHQTVQDIEKAIAAQRKEVAALQAQEGKRIEQQKDLALAQERLVKLERDRLKLLTELNFTSSEVGQKVFEHKEALRKLEQQFKSNQITLKEYNEQSQVHETVLAGISEHMDEYQKRLHGLTEAEDSATEATKRSTEAKKKNKEATDELAEANRNQAEAASFSAGLADAIAATIDTQLAKTQQLSSATANYFRELQGFATVTDDNFDHTNATIEELTAHIDEVRQTTHKWQTSATQDITGIMSGYRKWYRELERNSIKAQEAFLNEQLQFKKLKAEIEDGKYTMQELAEMPDYLDYKFKLLDGSQMDDLRRSISDARREFEALAETIDRQTESIQDRLDRLKGNESDILRRRYERERAELEALMQQARQAGDEASVRQLKEALKQLAEIYKHELEEINGGSIRDLANVARDQTSQTGQSGNIGDGGYGLLPRSSAFAASSTASQSYTINLNLPNGETATINASDGNSLDELMKAFNALGATNLANLNG